MRGDHISVRRWGYTHHGIDLGDGRVVHFTGEPGSKAKAEIAVTTLAEFLRGGTCRTVAYASRFEGDAAADRALSRRGESGYSLVWKNCEHFARWCRTGEERSSQVRRAQTLAALAGLLGTRIVRRGAVGRAVARAGVMRSLSSSLTAAMVVVPIGIEIGGRISRWRRAWTGAASGAETTVPIEGGEPGVEDENDV